MNMDSITELGTKAEEFAGSLVDRDSLLVELLVEKRITSGLSVENLATRMGVSPKWVEEFEAYWSDPRLSELRRYEFALWEPSHE